jgi:hypothetical protein
MGALEIQVGSTVKEDVVVDDDSVRRIAQFPRDVRVSELRNRVNLDNLGEMEVVRQDANEIPSGIDRCARRARSDARVGEYEATVEHYHTSGGSMYSCTTT